MRIYISGAITGKWDYLEQFEKAEMILKEQGYSVINPAKINSLLPENTTHEQYMTVSLALLSTCEAIYMLNGWKNSEGATTELRFSVDNDMTVWLEGKQCNVPKISKN